MLGVIILCGGLGLQSLFAWYSSTGVNLSAFFSHVVGLIVRWSGVARQPLPFFASPKKGSKERRPQPSLPFGFPFVQDKKWESFETRFPCRARLRLRAKTVTQAMCMHIETPAKPQTTKLSFSIFCPAQMAVPDAEKAKHTSSMVSSKTVQHHKMLFLEVFHRSVC